MGNPTYRSMGKQILRDGRHFAATCHPDAAAALVTLLNADEIETTGVAQAELDRMVEVLWS